MHRPEEASTLGRPQTPRLQRLSPSADVELQQLLRWVYDYEHLPEPPKRDNNSSY